MPSVQDDRGYNQGFRLNKSTITRMRRRVDWIIAEMDDLEGANVLEIGCGTGEVSFWLAQKTPARVWGTDLCAPFIEEAKEKYQLPNLHYSVLDFIAEGEIEGAPFDYIVGNGILHHLYHQLDDSLLRIKGLLKEGGKILFMEPNYHNPYVYLIFTFPFLRRIARLEPDEMAFTRKFAVRKLQHTGFTDIRIDYRDFLLPGVPDALIRPSIVVGNILERIPLLRSLSQSIFIRATKK